MLTSQSRAAPPRVAGLAVDSPRRWPIGAADPSWVEVTSGEPHHIVIHRDEVHAPLAALPGGFQPDAARRTTRPTRPPGRRECPKVPDLLGQGEKYSIGPPAVLRMGEHGIDVTAVARVPDRDGDELAEDLVKQRLQPVGLSRRWLDAQPDPGKVVGPGPRERAGDEIQPIGGGNLRVPLASAMFATGIPQ